MHPLPATTLAPTQIYSSVSSEASAKTASVDESASHTGKFSVKTQQHSSVDQDTLSYAPHNLHQLMKLQYMLNQQQNSAQIASVTIKNAHDTAMTILSNLK